MTEQNYKAFFGSSVNIDRLINNVLKPILGKFSENPASGTNYATKDDYKQLATSANIQSIFHKGDFNVGAGDNVAVFEVVLGNNCNITRARKGIQEIVRKLIREVKVGAFIIFHYDSASARLDKETWRFSWVEKTGTEASATSAKRYTYLCGPSYSCRTIAERFVELEKKAKEPTFDSSDITAAFDVEALSKDFFREYKIFYDDIIQWITGTRYVGEKKVERKPGLTKSATDLYTPFADKCKLVYAKDWSSMSSEEQTEKTEKFIRDWVKKLLGRLVFLQFIQKKGWLGIAENNPDWKNGKENFLLDQFNDCAKKGKNFLKDELYAILFDSLNKSTDTDSSDVKVTKRDGIKYPFLNGGLFEEGPADQLHIELPNKFFHNENHSKARTLSRTGYRKNEEEFFSECGILDFFSHYNFTIDENATNDEMGEVGIDPEMLSKVFENLLEDNKEKGAFYTPKEIVNYMCKESLIAYLNTKVTGMVNEIRAFVENIELSQTVINRKTDIIKALYDVKICDPAVGSGAFPMGLLNLILKLRLALNDDDCCDSKDKKYDYASLISTIKNAEQSENGLDDAAKAEKEKLSRIKCAIKKSIIQNNIYGVDIEKGAVDLARLRFWLNIVVDEGKPTPLPNLDFKIMQGNSLIEQYAGIDLFHLATMKKRKKCEVKCDLFGEIDGVEKDVLYVPDEYAKFNLQEELNKYFDISNPDKKKSTREFIEKYIHCVLYSTLQVQVTEKQQALTRMDQVSTLNKKQLKTKGQLEDEMQVLNLAIENLDSVINGQFFLWHTWFADVFNNGGFDIVIGNPPYGLINKKQNQEDGVIVPKKIFEIYKNSNEFSAARGGMLNIFRLFVVHGGSLLKNNGVFCEIFPLAFTCDQSSAKLREYILNNYQILNIEAFPERDNPQKRVFYSAKMSVCILIFKNKKEIEKPFSLRINREPFVEENKTKSTFTFRQIISVDNKYYTIPLTEKYDSKLLIKIYSVSKPYSELGKCYTGEIDMTFCKKAFTTNPADLNMLRGAHIDRYIVKNVISQGEVFYLDANVLSKIKKGVNQELFASPRIVLQGVTGVNEKIRLKMTLVKDTFCANSANYCLFNDVNEAKSMLALFNSKLMNYVFKLLSTNSNVNGYEVDNLPIAKGFFSIDKIKLIDSVESILAAKKANPQADTSFEETLIDILVYLLYNLTFEEVQMVDNKFTIKEEEYSQWLANYQNDGTLPTEAEMRRALEC